ncbi:MAG: glycosyltransferase [Rhodobacteraceae bacterium]|nr:glycosyltransferase [Paracoccaceae bacterium]
MKIACLVNTYPSPSHTFIRRELQALERRGITVVRMAMRSDRARLVDPEDRAEDARTEHVLERGGAALLRAALGALLAGPGRFGRALALAWRCGARAEGGARLRHLIYLAEAAHVADRCAAEGVAHVHAHFGTNSATVAMLARALGGPGYSFTVHGPEEFDHPRALALDLKVRRARFTVAISAFGRSQLCRLVPYGNWDRLHVVRCGIPLAGAPPPAPLPPGPLRLVNVGRFSEQKGHLVALDALARARTTTPGLHLTLVGDGTLRGAIEARIAALDLGDAVTLAGWQDGPGVRAALDAAHVLLLPSFAEGLPVVLMEALAAGRPAIATWVAGIPELVRADCGWLVPAGDAAALTHAIIAAAGTAPETLAAMGAAGAARVRAQHDIDRQAEALHHLFDTACAACPEATTGG